MSFSDQNSLTRFFSSRFRKASDLELIADLNQEIQLKSSTRARATYLQELQREIKRRGWDYNSLTEGARPYAPHRNQG
ncbi:hypothetical protein [Dyadobacter tibetensis]|uniref:hypothetical protein n=1 Tax=Dyadobacter tibetensis TaxID=1211851 RepID=UPI0004721EF7|nr:hypothetical protein [Dyadobacter tibetensis]